MGTRARSRGRVTVEPPSSLVTLSGVTGGVTARTLSASKLVTGDTKTLLFSLSRCGDRLRSSTVVSYPAPTSKKGTDLNLDVYLKANFDTTPPLVNCSLI